MSLTNAEAAARVARRNETALPDKTRIYLGDPNVSRLKSDPMTKGRSLGIEMIDIVPAAVPLDAMESRTVVAGAETGLAGMAQPAERSTSRDDGTVPVKQLLRWQDDGGALPPDG